jgi:hypothetical protein
MMSRVVRRDVALTPFTPELGDTSDFNGAAPKKEPSEMF